MIKNFKNWLTMSRILVFSLLLFLLLVTWVNLTFNPEIVYDSSSNPGSMYPESHERERYLIIDIKPDNLKVGDWVVAKATKNIMHTVIGIYYINQSMYLVTSGIQNLGADYYPGVGYAIPFNLIEGKVIYAFGPGSDFFFSASSTITENIYILTALVLLVLWLAFAYKPKSLPSNIPNFRSIKSKLTPRIMGIFLVIALISLFFSHLFLVVSYDGKDTQLQVSNNDIRFDHIDPSRFVLSASITIDYRPSLTSFLDSVDLLIKYESMTLGKFQWVPFQNTLNGHFTIRLSTMFSIQGIECTNIIYLELEILLHENVVFGVHSFASDALVPFQCP